MRCRPGVDCRPWRHSPMLPGQRPGRGEGALRRPAGPAAAAPGCPAESSCRTASAEPGATTGAGPRMAICPPGLGLASLMPAAECEFDGALLGWPWPWLNRTSISLLICSSRRRSCSTPFTASSTRPVSSRICVSIRSMRSSVSTAERPSTPGITGVRRRDRPGAAAS